MTQLTRDDVRAAVTAGVLDEGQAAKLVQISETRRGVREHLSGLDEPFELFKGFNEVFIVVGLSILYLGWAGLTGLSVFGSIESGYLAGLVFAALGMIALVLLGRYFTLKRRMVAPSIALSIMFSISAWQFGLSVSAAMDLELQGSITLSAVVTGAALAAHYFWFRVPFSVALIALSVVAATFGMAALGGAQPDSIEDFFLLSADGTFALITVGLGLIGLIIALSFDMSDPHRLTRRSASGFWLHVLAAPAIVNTVALTLFQQDSVMAQILLVAFIAVMALLAVVIDRRSFLVSGVGYIVALSFTVVDGNAFIVILLFGAGLVLLGAQWEVLRRAIMTSLPEFAGKRRLPPWDHTPTEVSS